MQSFVFAAVLFAAACHAGWNALVKVGLDPLSTTVLIAVGAAAVSLAGLPFVGLPASASWPWLIASVVVHVFYFAALAESYRTGDLGQVYPIARGAAPLMTASASALFLGEHLNLFGWAGIVVLAAGVLLLSARGGPVVHLERRAVGYALITALTICAYSLIDGIGARLSQNPQAYVAWVFVANAVVLVPYGLWRNATNMTLALRRFWGRGLAGGALQALSYGIVLWAMTLAPIAIVAGLRETSVLFGGAYRRARAQGAAAGVPHARGGPDRLRARPDPAAIGKTQPRTRARAQAGLRRTPRNFRSVNSFYFTTDRSLREAIDSRITCRSEQCGSALHMELTMKETIDVRQTPPAVSSDSGKVRIGNFSPAFPPVRGPAATSDTTKVRIGSMTPAFPSMRGPAITSDGGKVRIGSIAPAFPPVRGTSAAGDTAKVRIGSVSPAFPPRRSR